VYNILVSSVGGGNALRAPLLNRTWMTPDAIM
jgi:hypothetical protein